MKILDRLWGAISEGLFGDSASPGVSEEGARQRAQATAPVVWLLGKTGAGKTAIVSTLTGDPRAVVGAGFEPCTRTASFYDVPQEVPIIRFLDTRGLDEADYDPANDIAWCEDQSHLLLVVMQVADPLQERVLRVLRAARARHPDWPVVVAQTGLHRLYPAGAHHPDPYPFTGGAEDTTNPLLPHALRQALSYQRQLLAGLRGVGASAAQAASGLLALCAVQGIAIIWLNQVSSVVRKACISCSRPSATLPTAVSPSAAFTADWMAAIAGSI